MKIQDHQQSKFALHTRPLKTVIIGGTACFQVSKSALNSDIRLKGVIISLNPLILDSPGLSSKNISIDFGQLC